MKRITPDMKLVRSARIRDPFYGWTGDTVIELDNGQRWIQARYLYRYRVTIAIGPGQKSGRLEEDASLKSKVLAVKRWKYGLRNASTRREVSEGVTGLTVL